MACGEYNPSKNPLDLSKQVYGYGPLNPMGIMSRILSANPINESRELPTGGVIATTTIFRHLTEKGLSPETLENLIPVTANTRHRLGSLYGFDIFIGSNGRFVFDADTLSPEEVAENAIRAEAALQVCKHTGFVVRDIQGENRFLCRECNERFPRHPQMIKIVHHTAAVTRATMEDMRATLDEFRQGAISFSSAMKVLNTNLEEFTKACSQLFPPEIGAESIHNISTGESRILQVSEHARTSCPKEVEEWFSDPSIYLDPMEAIEKFPDITEARYEFSASMTDRIEIVVDFIDGSTQVINTRDIYYDPCRGKTVNPDITKHGGWRA